MFNFLFWTAVLCVGVLWIIGIFVVLDSYTEIELSDIEKGGKLVVSIIRQEFRILRLTLKYYLQGQNWEDAQSYAERIVKWK